ncbi:MAG: septum formation initiator family protein [Microscillaceae bacterium]|nr:septum formation initiator family protein [Microscillaceae bacterium]
MMKIPKIFKNFFVLSSLLFVVWILFLDTNDLITQYRRKQKTRQLIQEKKYYEQQIKQIEKGYRELLNNPRILEKFAREKYFLKRDKEDVYIIVEEEAKTQEKE